MAVYKQPKSKYWWCKFTWNGEPIRQSTKQSNKRVAEQMEAAHRTALAKGEVGIREKKPVPTLKDFAEHDFLPFVRSTFSAKEKTLKYYEYGVKSLLAFEKLASARLDSITTETIGAFIAARKEPGVQISSIIASCNRSAGCFTWRRNGARSRRPCRRCAWFPARTIANGS